jgi:FixJ family two-component response regulator
MSSSSNTYVAIVDDDESLRRSLSRLLRAAGLQPIVYPSAEAFLSDGNQPRFGCLVLDIRLGGISGIELQERLSHAGSTTPVIFVTAHDDPKEREEAIAAGCTGFFRKSDAGASLLSAIKTATERPFP